MTGCLENTRVVLTKHQHLYSPPFRGSGRHLHHPPRLRAAVGGVTQGGRTPQGDCREEQDALGTGPSGPGGRPLLQFPSSPANGAGTSFLGKWPRCCGWDEWRIPGRRAQALRLPPAASLRAHASPLAFPRADAFLGVCTRDCRKFAYWCDSHKWHSYYFLFP